MVHGDRTERLALRLTPEEAEVVALVSEESGLSVSDVVRQALRLAYPDRFKAPAKKRKRK